MLAKRVERSGKDCYEHLPYVLCAYRTSIQTSTWESSFYLLHGWDPQLPTDKVLSVPEDRRMVDMRDYKTEMTYWFTEAWKVAQYKIHKAQKSQKENYDWSATPSKVHVGDQVFYLSAEKTGKAYKFAHLYVGPYRVLDNNGANVKLISKPNDSPIRMLLNWVRLCPDEIKDLEEYGDQVVRWRVKWAVLTLRELNRIAQSWAKTLQTSQKMACGLAGSVPMSRRMHDHQGQWWEGWGNATFIVKYLMCAHTYM